MEQQRDERKQKNVMVPIGVYYILCEYFLMNKRAPEYEVTITNFLEHKQDMRYLQTQWRAEHLPKWRAQA